MPAFISKVKPKTELSIAIIRKDGTREELGVVASSSRWWRLKRKLRLT